MGKAHVLAVSVPAQGHVIPLMELSVSLAKHGIKITFVNSESAHKLVVNASSSDTKDDDDMISLVSIPDGDQPEILKKVIENINATADSDKITCVLADPGLSWAMEVADEMKIRRAILSPFAATLLVLKSSIPKLIQDGIIGEDGTPIKKKTIQLSPTIPAIETSHFSWICYSNSELLKFWLFEYASRCNKSMKLADKILCNSNYDLEPAAFEMNPKILPIGPLLTSNQQTAGNFWAEDSGFNRDDHGGGLIARQEIQNKLEELLGNEKYRANALDLKEKLRNSIKQGGCSYSNFISFVEWLKEEEEEEY
ncbi:hypothetical protein QYF36_003811 [Acer negundo]|nr:hypothetical protein QYF36_003811 [Acer negundo]